MPVVELHLEGNWVGVEKLTNGLPESIRKGYEKGSEKFSKVLIGVVRRAIKSGRPPQGSGAHWEPLSDNTIKRWGNHGIYNLKGVYSRSIGIHKYKSRTFVGVPIGSRPSNPNSSLTLNQVAIILEYGGNKIPDRPLWAPSLKSVGGTSKLKKEIIHGIRTQLYKDFGINPKQIR